MPKFSRPTSYNGRLGNQSKRGSVRFATTSEAAAGTETRLAISPNTLDSAVESLIEDATTTTKGIIRIASDAEAVTGTATDLAMTPHTVGLIAIAGAPLASESLAGIAELATQAETDAGTDDATMVTPLKLTTFLTTPAPIGGTTPNSGIFTDLSSTGGTINFDAGGSWDSQGTDIDIATDADVDAVNIGTSASARTITIGNVTGATAVAINTGTGSFAVATTGTGDITLNSDDTMLLDADGVLELNSSGGVIGIGNDADANNINIGTGAAARTITLGNSTGATSVVLNSGTGPISIGTNAIAHSITIGNNVGATAIVMDVGTGDFDLNGVGASTYTMGAATTSGTFAIGGTSQTGDFDLGPSDGAMTMNIANADGAKTINVGAGVDGNTISLGNGINTSAQVINFANGASGADSTVNILSGNGTAGTQTLNVLGGTRAGALNLGTGAAAHAITIGSSSAAEIDVDSGAGIRLNAATASNFTITAGLLTVQSTSGQVQIISGQDVANAILIKTDAGTSEQIHLRNMQGTGVDGIWIDAFAGGMTLDAALASSDAININASAGGVDIDAALDVVVTSTENAANSIYLHADGGTAETIRLHSDQGTGVGSVTLESDVGGLLLQSGLASDDAINVSATAGGVDIDGALQVNIASSEAAADAIVINASDAAGGIDVTTGGGSIDLSSAGSVTMVAGTDTQPGDTCTVNKNVFACTYTGFTTAAGATQTFTITNSVATTTSQVILSCSNLGANDAQMTVQRIKQLAGSIEVYTINNGAAALNGNVVITGWIIG